MARLREYQSAAVRKLMKAKKSALLISPTGSGKTKMVSSFVKRKGFSCLAVAHRIEIRRQIEKEFAATGIENFAVFGSSSMRAVAEIKGFDCLFVDEAHHAPARTFERLVTAARENGVFVIGATATPYRHDGVSIRPFFDDVVKCPSPYVLSQAGYLARVRYVAASGVDFYKERTELREESEAALSRRVRAVVIAGNVSAAWRRYARGKRALIYCVNQEHCEMVRRELSGLGHRVEVVTSNTSARDRNESIGRFVSGKTQGLINCQVFTEGTDLPNVGAIIMLKPTLSRGLYKQMIGRGLRPDVDCVVLDHVGNCERHGNVMVEDEIEWMDKGRSMPVWQRDSVVAVEPMKLVAAEVEANMRAIWVPDVFKAAA